MDSLQLALAGKSCVVHTGQLTTCGGWPGCSLGDIICARPPEHRAMRPLFVLVAWFFLLVLCWPVALLVLVLWPLLWLISLPFRLVGITFEKRPMAVFRTSAPLPPAKGATFAGYACGASYVASPTSF